MSSSTWTFGPGGVYTAVWDGVDTLTVTLTATGAFIESFSGQSLSSLVGQLQQFTQQPALPSAVSGQFLCVPSMYAPSSQVTLPVSTTTMAPFNPGTTVAAGSNSGEVSQIGSWAAPSAGVLDVTTTAGWPSSGTVAVATSTTPAIVTYTGTAGGNQLTGCTYVSGSPTGTVATGGAVALTSVALNTGSFTAPASGNVVVTASMALEISAGGNKVALGLAAAGTAAPLVAPATTVVLGNGSTASPAVAQFLVTGLTPGASYNLTLLGCATSATTATILAIGSTSTALGSAGSPVLLTVQAV